MPSDEWLITQDQLADAIEHESLGVMDITPGQPSRYVRATDAAARILAAVDDLADGGDPSARERGHLGNPADEALERCRAALSRLSQDNRYSVVSALVADAVKTGTPKVLEPEPLSYDPEVQAIATIADLLNTLTVPARGRIVRWAASKYGD